MSTIEMVWEDPPPRRSLAEKTSKWQPIMDQLKATPGKWARLSDGKSSGGWFKSKGFETATRTTPEGPALYVRWPDEVASDA